jgi:tetratricopeptide (TPR) repeat protein
MRLAANQIRSVTVLALVLLAGGCQSRQSALSEEKEPHFRAGKSRVTGMDYPAAIECFEMALQTNPRSAAAHFELALLYEKSKPDPAAAIYHFQKFLELRPNSEFAEVVKQRILASKQELARTVSLGPVTQSLQREFEQLAQENQRLREELERLRSAVPVAGGMTGVPPASPLAESSFLPGGTGNDRFHTQTPPLSEAGRKMTPSRDGTSAATARSHTVKSGETPTAIAKKYGVPLESLLAANPRLEPRRMRVGQVLSVPGT